MALPPNFSIYPLVGDSGQRADGVDPQEILNYLFKKSFGIPNTRQYITYANELYSYNSTQNLLNTNIYSQFIPYNAPSDLNQDSILNYKYTSQSFPYIAYYSNVIMNSINNTSFNVIHNSILISNKCIPYFFGDPETTSYKIIVTTNTNTELFFGSIPHGSWIMDTDSGVLTFYDDVSIDIVNSAYPPRISYWRYEGLTGNANIVEVFDA